MKKINIREALLNMDRATDCEFDLTSLYEACDLDDKKKEKLVQYIDAYDIDATNKFLSNEAGSQGLMEEVSDDLTEDEFKNIMGEAVVHMTDETTFNPLVRTQSLKVGDMVYDEDTGHKCKILNIINDGKYSKQIALGDTVNQRTYTQISGNNALWEVAVEGDTAHEVDDDDNIHNLNEYFSNGTRVTCDYKGDSRNGQSGTVVGGFRVPGASTYTVEWDDGTKSKIIGDWLVKEKSKTSTNESLDEELWDTSRANELVAYYLDGGDYATLELCYIIMNQMKEEGRKLPYNITDFFDAVYKAADEYNKQFEDGPINEEHTQQPMITESDEWVYELTPLLRKLESDGFTGEFVWKKKRRLFYVYSKGTDDNKVFKAITFIKGEGNPTIIDLEADPRLSGKIDFEEPPTHCVYFSLDGGKTHEVEFEGTEAECQQYLDNFDHDEQRALYGNDYPERFIKKLGESVDTSIEPITAYKDELELFLRDKHFSFEFDTPRDDTLVIDIEGDWKHDHLYLDTLVRDFFADKGLTVISYSYVTEEDGSDYYRANHCYKFDAPMEYDATVLSLQESIGVGSYVTHVDDGEPTRGIVYRVKDGVATVCVGGDPNDIVEVPLDKLQLDEGFFGDLGKVAKSGLKTIGKKLGIDKAIKPVADKIRNTEVVRNMVDTAKGTETYMRHKDGQDYKKVLSNIRMAKSPEEIAAVTQQIKDLQSSGKLHTNSQMTVLLKQLSDRKYQLGIKDEPTSSDKPSTSSSKPSNFSKGNTGKFVIDKNSKNNLPPSTSRVKPVRLKGAAPSSRRRPLVAQLKESAISFNDPEDEFNYFVGKISKLLNTLGADLDDPKGRVTEDRLDIAFYSNVDSNIKYNYSRKVEKLLINYFETETRFNQWVEVYVTPADSFFYSVPNSNLDSYVIEIRARDNGYPPYKKKGKSTKEDYQLRRTNTAVNEAVATRPEEGDGTQWYVGDDTGRIYYSKKDAEQAYKQLVDDGFENVVMEPITDEEWGNGERLTESNDNNEYSLSFVPVNDVKDVDLTTRLCDVVLKMGGTYHSARKYAGNYYITVVGSPEDLHRVRLGIENCGFFKAWLNEDIADDNTGLVLSESSYGRVPMLPLDDENDFRFYVYKDEDNVVSDGYEFFEDAINFAKDNNYPLVKVHLYFRDKESGKLYPNGDPKVVWDNGEPLLDLDYSILDENIVEPIDDTVDLEYKNLTVVRRTRPKFRNRWADNDDWDEHETTTDWTLSVPKEDVITFIIEYCLEDDEFPGIDWGNMSDEELMKLVGDNLDKLFNKYETRILDYWEDEAVEDATTSYVNDPDYYDGGYNWYKEDMDAQDEGPIKESITSELIDEYAYEYGLTKKEARAQISKKTDAEKKELLDLLKKGRQADGRASFNEDLKIYKESDLTDFEFWAGARDTVKYLSDEQIRRIAATLEDAYPKGMTETEINDFFWFEDDTIAEWLGYDSFEDLMEDSDLDESIKEAAVLDRPKKPIANVHTHKGSFSGIIDAHIDELNDMINSGAKPMEFVRKINGWIEDADLTKANLAYAQDALRKMMTMRSTMQVGQYIWNIRLKAEDPNLASIDSTPKKRTSK